MRYGLPWLAGAFAAAGWWLDAALLCATAAATLCWAGLAGVALAGVAFAGAALPDPAFPDPAFPATALAASALPYPARREPPDDDGRR